MTTIVNAAGAAELLAAIPMLTGFTPRNSLVLLPFCKARTAGALRLDLPAPPGESGPTGASGPTTEEFAATAIGLTCRIPDTDALAIAVYLDPDAANDATPDDASPSAPSEDEPLPAAALVAELMLRAEACGLHVVEALHIGSTTWADYLDPEAEPRALVDVPAAPVVPGFAGPAPDQLSGTALPAPGLLATESVGRALLAVERVLGPADPMRTPRRCTEPIDPRARGIALMLDDLPAFLERVLDAPEALSPFETAALIWILNRPSLRDVALVQWAGGIALGDTALAAQLSFREDGKPVPVDVGGIMIGHGPRPDGDRLGVALALVRRTIALAPRPTQGGSLAAAAWLSWASGRSTHASHYLDLLDEVDPDLSFGQLLRAVVTAGMLPDWAFGAARAA